MVVGLGVSKLNVWKTALLVARKRRIKSFRFPDNFAPRRASHRFKIATVQYSNGLVSSAPGIFFLRARYDENAFPKTVPQCNSTRLSTLSLAQLQSGQLIGRQVYFPICLRRCCCIVYKLCSISRWWLSILSHWR